MDPPSDAIDGLTHAQTIAQAYPAPKSIPLDAPDNAPASWSADFDAEDYDAAISFLKCKLEPSGPPPKRRESAPLTLLPDSPAALAKRNSLPTKPNASNVASSTSSNIDNEPK